jgi:hypothetical protein
MVSAKRKQQLLKAREAKQNLKYEAKTLQNSELLFDDSSTFETYDSDSVEDSDNDSEFPEAMEWYPEENNMLDTMVLSRHRINGKCNLTDKINRNRKTQAPVQV